ncbi:hypothetical protein B0T17DRAFT_621538 [Bombardia bombarda]|uniref:Uncharacterized protein n=1 Tax=Bombardia bombarda TaxID=252184 RepID=A0AA39WCB2_9PEZI|nr:hypothetical protein B0T17DRAFT_621538 [Bombardia bombarda]
MASPNPERENKEWPFAQSLTGQHLGALQIGVLRRIECWDAIGPARDDFTNESDSIVNLSLFMVGRSVQKTKPTVMFVSDDKTIRKEAFKLVKEKFKGHRQIGDHEDVVNTATPATVVASTASEGPPLPVEIWSEAHESSVYSKFLYTRLQDNSMNFAAAGGVVIVDNEPMLFTVCHMVAPTASPMALLEPDIDDDEDGECEITGLGDDSEH